MSRHAKFSPSSMERTILCPASWIEKQARPDPPPSKFAQHGSLLHEYVVRTYDNGLKTVLELSKEADRNYVLTCVDYINTLKSQCGAEYELALETKVTLDPLGLPDIWGTADVIVYDKDTQMVHVVDWKFGSGVKVYADKNNQGISYMAGAAALYPEAEHFIFHLVQPPLLHLDKYAMDREDLLNYVEDVFKLAVIKATKDDPEYSPSESACRWCVAKYDCVARHDLAMEQARQVFALKNPTKKIKEEDIANFLHIMPNLRKYMNELEKYAEDLIKEDHGVKGYKLVHGKISRSIKDQKQMAKWLADNTYQDLDRFYTYKMKSPAQIEKIDDTLKTNDEFQDMIVTKKGKLKIVKESDPRPSYKPVNKAKEVFAKYLKTTVDEDLDAATALKSEAKTVFAKFLKVNPST